MIRLEFLDSIQHFVDHLLNNCIQKLILRKSPRNKPVREEYLPAEMELDSLAQWFTERAVQIADGVPARALASLSCCRSRS